MRARSFLRKAWPLAALVVSVGALAQAQSAPPAQNLPAPAQEPVRPTQREVIRRAFDIITTDVIVRDSAGQFLPDLKKSDFAVYEDDVKQDVVSFVLIHGGRAMNLEAPPPPPPQEGIILPPAKPTSDASGRIFIIFVDDLHLDFRNTGRIRDLFQRIAKELIHEGDLFGIVSTGPSSIAIDLTYDRKRLDEALKKISGAGLRPQEILDVPLGQDGPPEVKYRANVAFSTAYELLKNLEQVHNRRKALIYVSNGYDFNPFTETRAKNEAELTKQMSDPNTDNTGSGESSSSDNNPFQSNNRGEFSFAELAAQLSELTREANRANATIYTIDPRGLVGGPDLDEKIDPVEWQDYVTTSQNSLRVLAELTGGIAVVNQNDFTKALKRIDSETSDYYVVGYYSNNVDPTKRRRKIDVKVSRPDATVWYRTSYSLRPKPVVPK